MNITVENTKGLAKQEDKLKTYAQTTMKGAMPAPRIAPSATGMLRTASLSKQAYFDSTTQPTFWYSPELTPDAWLLPKSREETLRFCQVYYNLDPYIHSILNMHAQYGFSKFFLQYKDPNITALFNKLLFNNQTFDWYQFTLDVALSYYKYGEAIVWGDWNAARRTWNRFTLLHPALVHYKEDLVTGHATMELIPTNEMKRIVKDAIIQGRRDIDPLLLNAVENNKKLPLDTEGVPENEFTGQEYIPPKVFMFARRTDPSAERGTSMLQCARGNTRVKLLDGTTPTMEELYKTKKKNFWVYSIDKDGSLVFKLADQVIYKGKALTYNVTLDNGAVLGFTADHPFMLRDGSWKCVQDLKPGDALMPLYTKVGRLCNKKEKTATQYERVYDPKTGTYKLTHVKVMLQENKDQMHLCGPRVIHHKDYNSLNNTPENLQMLSRSEHAAIHAAHTNSEHLRQLGFAKVGVRAKNMDKFSNTMKAYWNAPEYREHILIKQKQRWENMTVEERLTVGKNISEGLTRKYDALRTETAMKIQKVVDKLVKGAKFRPSLRAIAAELGISETTVFNYVNKYKLVVLPDFPVTTIQPDWDSIAKVQKLHNKHPEYSRYRLAKELGMPSSRVYFYFSRGFVETHAFEYKNHKVVSVTPAQVEDVYDISSVADTHNYMVMADETSGVCVHNCLFKDMIYKDQLRLSQLAVAQKTQLPIELWTVGHIGNDDQSSMLPGPELLEEVRQMITQATQQPPFSIVYGPYLKYEALGVSGKLLDIYNDLGYVENQILVGLGVNKAVVLGEGPSVQGKAISLNRLIREYAVVRDLFSNWFKRNILLPIAKANHLLDEEGQYIVPELVWELSLQPEQDKETFDMFYKMWKDGLISTMTLFEKCPKKIDYTLEMSRLSDERGTVFDKGDKRLGKLKTKVFDKGSEIDGTSEAASKGVEAGKGNQALRDFALGAEGEDLEGLDTQLGTGAENSAPENTPEGEEPSVGEGA